MAEKKIGSRLYKVGYVPATDALRLKARLMQIVGGGVSHLPTILAGAGKSAAPEARSASNAAAVAALSDIATKAEPDMVVKLFSDIVGLAQVKRPSGAWEALDLDGDFTEHKQDLYPVVAFVLQETFRDFFSESVVSGALQRMKDASG